jgi:hypothetical protein
MRRGPRLTLASIVAAVLAAGAAVALGAPSRAADNSPITKAFQKTGKVTSGHFSFSLNVTGGGSQLPAGGVTLGGSGGFDAKAKNADFQLDLGSLAGLAGATAGGQVPQTIEVRVVKGVAYVYLPTFAKTLGPGKEWLKVDAATLPKSTTGGLDPGQLTSMNPQQALAKLTASLSTHKLGSAKIRGKSTSRYRVSVNLTKVVGLLPKAQRPSALKGLRRARLKALPIDVYVDGSGYVRRVATKLKNLTAQAGTAPVSLGLTLDFFDFGTSVHVEAPPEAQTADAGPLLAQLLGGVGGSTGSHP